MTDSTYFYKFHDTTNIRAVPLGKSDKDTIRILYNKVFILPSNRDGEADWSKPHATFEYLLDYYKLGIDELKTQLEVLTVDTIVLEGFRFYSIEDYILKVKSDDEFNTVIVNLSEHNISNYPGVIFSPSGTGQSLYKISQYELNELLKFELSNKVYLTTIYDFDHWLQYHVSEGLPLGMNIPDWLDEKLDFINSKGDSDMQLSEQMDHEKIYSLIKHLLIKKNLPADKTDHLFGYL